jgi:hypothetical protein
MMQKIILGLIIVFGLLGCKSPEKEVQDAVDKAEEAKRQDDIRTDKKDFQQSAHYTSANLGLWMEILHAKSVAHSSSKIKREALNFSIKLLGIEIRDGYALPWETDIEASKSVADSLQLYINDIPQVLVPKICRDITGLFERICEYNYSFDPKNITDEPLNIKVNLTRANGEILSAVFDLPARIRLLEPHIPFKPIAFSDTTLLSWQSELPIHLYFKSWAECSLPLDKTVEVGALDTSYMISSGSFQSRAGCDPTKLSMILNTSKEWELQGSNFKKVNIRWGDSLHLFLFGKYEDNYVY